MCHNWYEIRWMIAAPTEAWAIKQKQPLLNTESREPFLETWKVPPPTFGNAFGKLREGPASDQWLNFLEEVLQLTSRTNFILTASTKLRRKLKRLTDVQSSLQGKCTKGTGAPRPDLDFPLMDLGESQLCLKLHKMN